MKTTAKKIQEKLIFLSKCDWF